MVSKEYKKGRFLPELRNYFTTGLLVLAPSVFTIWILVQVFRIRSLNFCAAE